MSKSKPTGGRNFATSSSASPLLAFVAYPYDLTTATSRNGKQLEPPSCE
jgi:hypothetical protein